jgi:hypothetical protein
MSQYLRMAFVFQAIVAIATIAVIYARAAKPLVKMGTSGNFQGFLSTPISQLDTVVPLVLAFLLLGTVVWFVAGGVRDEQSVNRRRPRP